VCGRGGHCMTSHWAHTPSALGDFRPSPYREHLSNRESEVYKCVAAVQWQTLERVFN